MTVSVPSSFPLLIRTVFHVREDAIPGLEISFAGEVHQVVQVKNGEVSDGCYYCHYPEQGASAQVLEELSCAPQRLDEVLAQLISESTHGLTVLNASGR